MEGLSKKGFWLMVTCAYGAMFAQGILAGSHSVTSPVIRDDLHISDTYYGAMNSIGILSYLVWSLLAAISLQPLGFKTVLIIALVVAMIGGALTSFSYSFWLIVLMQFIAGSGSGSLDDTCNALASILFKENTGVLMLLLHSCYGIGAAFGPFYARKILEALPQYSFRGVTMLLNIPLAIILIVIAVTRFEIKKPKNENEENAPDNMTIKHALCSPSVWLASIILTLYGTAEGATGIWGGIYVEDVLHLDPKIEGANLNTAFYIVFTITRLVGGIIVDWLGAFTVEYSVAILSLIIYIVGLSVGYYGIYVLPAAGFAAAFYWPTFIVICMRYWGDKAATPVSCILPIQALLGIPIQYFLGWLNDHFGPRCAYWSTVPTITIALLLNIVFHFMIIRKEKKEKKEIEPLLETPSNEVV